MLLVLTIIVMTCLTGLLGLTMYFENKNKEDK